MAVIDSRMAHLAKADGANCVWPQVVPIAYYNCARAYRNELTTSGETFTMQAKNSTETWRWGAATLVIVVMFAAVLVLFDRPVVCKSGLGFWAPAWTSCTSQHLFDAYTLSHVLHGVIFYWLLRALPGRVSAAGRFVAAVALEIGWELVENSSWVIQYYRQETASLDYTGDSIVNSLADVVAMIGGFALASKMPWKAAIGVFVLVELIALYLARDNLTLNILVFFYPIEAIKAWQLAGPG